MTAEEFKRLGAVAGAGVFLLTLLLLLLFAEPGQALLAAVGAGAAAGAGVFVGGAAARLARPPAAPDRPASPPEPGSPPGGAESFPPPGETARLEPEQVVRAADLHATVRLDEEGLQYVLPEVSPEQVLREREGIDEEFLRAGVGIAEGGGASENRGGEQAGGT